MKAHNVDYTCRYDQEKTYVGAFQEKSFCNDIPIKFCFATINCVPKSKSVKSFSYTSVCRSVSEKCPPIVDDCQDVFKKELVGEKAIFPITLPGDQNRIVPGSAGATREDSR